ncbi:hypothetical protein Vretifemale_16544, partial [Volvox reticuliferus]
CKIGAVLLTCHCCCRMRRGGPRQRPGSPAVPELAAAAVAAVMMVAAAVMVSVVVMVAVMTVAAVVAVAPADVDSAVAAAPPSPQPLRAAHPFGRASHGAVAAGCGGVRRPAGHC